MENSIAIYITLFVLSLLMTVLITDKKVIIKNNRRRTFNSYKFNLDKILGFILSSILLVFLIDNMHLKNIQVITGIVLFLIYFGQRK